MSDETEKTRAPEEADRQQELDNKQVKKKKEDLPKPDQFKALKKKLEQAESEIKELGNEVLQWKDECLRQVADKDNLRKRLEREKNEFFHYAMSDLLKELLTVVDNFERAIQTQDQGDVTNFRAGVEMIYRQLLDVLMKQGVQPVEPEDRKFDPQFHQAFSTEESKEVKEAEISEVLQKGYMLRDRLLRPSLVKVLIPKKKDKKEDKEEE